MAVWLLAGITNPLAFGASAWAAPAYVQGKTGTLSSGSSVTATYSSAQSAGGVNVVFVGWAQATSGVQSVTDTLGNTYVAAIGPTVHPSGLSQIVYYAKSIAAAAAGTNTVTVTFNSSVSFPDVRILELSGVRTDNPLDAAVAGTGTGTAAGTVLNSGPLTTTSANELLVASNYCQHTCTTGNGAGYGLILTSQWNLVEDSLAETPGSYAATISNSASNNWIMQQVAFRSANTSADTTPPTPPAGFTASAVSRTQINLSWSPATDNVGIGGYLIERCSGVNCSSFVQVGTSLVTSFQDTGLSASTVYSYRIRSSDEAGNLSAYSQSVSDSTFVASTAYVQGSSGTKGSGSSVTAAYSGAQGAGDLNVVIMGWNQATSGVQSITDTSGNVYVAAIGPTVNPSGATQTVYYAKNIAAAAAGANTVTVTFNGSVSFPDVRILEFSGVRPDNPLDTAVAGIGTGTALNSGPLTTTSANELLVASTYCQHTCTTGAGAGYALILASQWNLVEDALAAAPGSYAATSTVSSSNYWIMQQVAFKTWSGSTTAPSAPASLAANGVSSSRIDLSWTASNADLPVATYYIERCQGTGCSDFAAAANTTTNSFSDTGLATSMQYRYRVRARDVAGNLSGYSNTVTVVTQTAGGGLDTTPPTPPPQLTVAGVSSGQVDLQWIASIDDAGVIAYNVEECQGVNCTNFTQIATSSVTSFQAIGLAPSTSFTYRVRAMDGAGNLSDYSNPVTAVTTAVGVICD